jgi:hypothetical protein
MNKNASMAGNNRIPGCLMKTVRAKPTQRIRISRRDFRKKLDTKKAINNTEVATGSAPPSKPSK